MLMAYKEREGFRRAVAGVKETVAEVVVPVLCEPRVMVGPVRAWQERNTEAIARNRITLQKSLLQRPLSCNDVERRQHDAIIGDACMTRGASRIEA
jgi:hypothetical protein